MFDLRFIAIFLIIFCFPSCGQPCDRQGQCKPGDATGRYQIPVVVLLGLPASLRCCTLPVASKLLLTLLIVIKEGPEPQNCNAKVLPRSKLL